MNKLNYRIEQFREAPRFIFVMHITLNYFKNEQTDRKRKM